jgi:hypothetical protein
MPRCKFRRHFLICMHITEILLCTFQASRLFTITMDFHGELDAEERLGVLASFRDRLESYDNLVVLDKIISGVLSVRPESKHSRWTPKLAEYFLHHKSWNIVKDPEVLPLITKRRNQVGNFLIIHSQEKRAIFAKVVSNDVVVYQVLSRPDGIFVDIHMESNRSLFYPFSAKESSFRSIYEKVKKKDMECAQNLHARTNLLKGKQDKHYTIVFITNPFNLAQGTVSLPKHWTMVLNINQARRMMF